jgi:hypothetical protein
VILFEVDAMSMTIELEGDTPRAVDVDGVSGRVEALQGVEIKAGNAENVRMRRSVQRVKPN